MSEQPSYHDLDKELNLHGGGQIPSGLRDLKSYPYSTAERRVAAYLHSLADGLAGGGDDPIGALIAMHNSLSYDAKRRVEKEAADKANACPGYDRHQWWEVESASGRDVACVRCHMAGERDLDTGDIIFPAT
jgi:hypothetical protein